MKQFRHTFTFLTLLLIASQALAQSEQLVAPGSNPVLKKFRAEQPNALRMQSASDTIDLPLIDDFSSTSVVPDNNNWIDQEVYINSTMPRNPITIGVATFDGLDANGNAYDNSSATLQGICDHLTSRPMYLHTKPSSLGGGFYTLADSITLSFFYEKKGWGDSPESNDSLVVEYYNPGNNKWTVQWAATGPVSAGQDTAFTSVRLTIRDSVYLKDGFRLRFHTFGSTTGTQDNWHLDYVRFYRGFNSFSGQLDTTLYDLAISSQNGSLINGFTSIPWDHFTSLTQSGQQALLKTTNTMRYRICDVQKEDVGFNERIYNYAGNYVAGDGAQNGNITIQLPQNTFLTHAFPVDSIFPNAPSMADDSTFFTVKDYFSNGNGFLGPKTNDTVTYRQEFYNYYSYDDGTAEAGYDLISAPNGKLAMRFDIIKPDTLRAIRIGFVQQLADVSTKLFSIKIWSSLSPETVLYQEYNKRPVYVDSVNGFSTYVLNSIVPVSGTIYIGFQQVAADGLHLGFDRNTNSNSKMFYNISGTWNQVTVAPGSFLMRPVMGDTTLFVGVAEQQLAGTFNVYPNPASTQISLVVENPSAIEAMEVSSTDGRNLYAGAYTRVLDVHAYPQGIYLVRLTEKSGATVFKRFIVSR